VFHNLGFTLARIRGSAFKDPHPDSWKCWSSGLESGPHIRQSLRYYVKASDLRPDDYRIRCYAASAAYILGNAQFMDRLNTDPIYRVSLANMYRERAKLRAFDTPSESRERYAKPIDEYQKAIDLDPDNVEALTGYADTFWEWQVSRSTARSVNGPDVATADRAEMYALRAVALVDGDADPITEALTRATLGKVLLARGRSTGAVRELGAAVAKLETSVARPPAHPRFHEVHWALAHAYRCVPFDDGWSRWAGTDVRTLETQAFDLLAKIRQSESGRELRPYTAAFEPWRPLLCSPESMRRDPPPF
jgi:tetratricopeptide (TPR) repeat protein